MQNTHPTKLSLSLNGSHFAISHSKCEFFLTNSHCGSEANILQRSSLHLTLSEPISKRRKICTGTVLLYSLKLCSTMHCLLAPCALAVIVLVGMIKLLFLLFTILLLIEIPPSSINRPEAIFSSLHALCHFTSRQSFRGVLLLTPFYKQGNWGLEELRKLF